MSNDDDASFGNENIAGRDLALINTVCFVAEKNLSSDVKGRGEDIQSRDQNGSCAHCSQIAGRRGAAGSPGAEAAMNGGGLRAVLKSVDRGKLPVAPERIGLMKVCAAGATDGVLIPVQHLV